MTRLRNVRSPIVTGLNKDGIAQPFILAKAPFAKPSIRRSVGANSPLSIFPAIVGVRICHGCSKLIYEGAIIEITFRIQCVVLSPAGKLQLKIVNCKLSIA